MKLSITKTELQRGLGRLQSIVETRNTMPILANVCLAAVKPGDSGALELAATDLEVGVRSEHRAVVDELGSITISAKKLYEIVRELPEEDIKLEISSGAYLSLRCARAVFTLAGTTADEYPTLPPVAPATMATVHAAVLGQMIERTLYAASTDETRYNLNGVFVEEIDDTAKLRMVATDGHRLAYVDRVFSTGLGDLATGVIIPRKGLIEIKRLIDEEDAEEVEIGFEANNALVQKHGVTLVMRLIEGEFPDYRQVIPQKPPHCLLMPTDLLRHGLRRVALLSSERSHAVKLDLSTHLLRLSSSNPDLGDAQEEIDVDYTGDEVNIAFNARYLLDCLLAMDAKEICLRFHDHLSPAVLTPADDEDTLAVVMPMRA